MFMASVNVSWRLTLQLLLPFKIHLDLNVCAPGTIKTAIQFTIMFFQTLLMSNFLVISDIKECYMYEL